MNALEFIWLLPCLPILGLLVGEALASPSGRDSAQRVTLVASALDVLGWGVALVALARLPESARAYTWQLTQNGQLGGLEIAPCLYIDTLSASLGWVVATAGMLVQAYALGDKSSRVSHARLAVALAVALWLLLAGNYLWLFIAWVGLSWVLYIGTTMDDTRLRSILSLGSLGDGALGLTVLSVFYACRSVGFGAFDRYVADELVPNGALALGIAGLLLVATLARLAHVALWIPQMNHDKRPMAEIAQLGSVALLPSAFYLLLRTQNVWMASPAVRLVALWLGTGGTLLCALLWATQRYLVRGMFLGVLAEAFFCLACLGMETPQVVAYQVMLQVMLGTALLLWIGIIRFHARDGDPLRALRDLFQHTRWALPVFIVALFTQMAVPLLGGFYGKGLLLAEAYRMGRFGLWLLGLASTGLISYYVWHLTLTTFLVPARRGDHTASTPVWMGATVVVLVGIPLAGGLWAGALQHGLLLAWSQSGVQIPTPQEPIPPMLALLPTLAILCGLVWARWLGVRLMHWRVNHRASWEHLGGIAWATFGAGAQKRWRSLLNSLRQRREEWKTMPSSDMLAPVPFAALALCSMVLYALWIR